MKKIKCKFSIATQYVRSEYSQTVEIEVEDDATQNEIDEQISEEYLQWVSDHNYGECSILE